MFQAISEVTNKSLVLDSSKEITRGYFLCSRFRDAKLIHLVRNGEEILASRYYRMRQNSYYQILRMKLNASHFHGVFLFITILTWVIGNVLIEIVSKLGGCDVHRVKYEDLCIQPTDEIEKIGNFLDVDVKTVTEKISQNRTLNVGHNIAGNGIRHKEDLKFDPKSRTKNLPTHYKIMFRVLSWPLLKFYNYNLF